MKNLILIGGGGHCKSVIDVIEKEGKYSIIGILDVKELIGTNVSGYKVIGTDDDIEIMLNRGCEFLITVGQIKSPSIRIKIYQKLKVLNATLANVYSPTAQVSEYSKIGFGSVIMHQAIVNAGTYIGSNCIINTKALIEHDCKLGDNCHISTGAIINGDCIIHNECFIGSNSVISNGINVAAGSIIGAGSVIINNITEEKSYIVGNPGRVIGK
jgi:sugar O-acyltransferase (sialic acid O-acetyltransferase NeuD family)